MIRWLASTRKLLVQSAQHWVADNAQTTGAALAFYSAFSLAPLLVILLMLAGLVVEAEVATQHVTRQLTALLGAQTAELLMGAVKGSQRVAGFWPTLISVVTLVVGATTVLAALNNALERIWNAPIEAISGIRGWLRARALAIGIIFALGFLLLVSLTVSTGLAAAGSWAAHRYEGYVTLVAILDFLVSLLLMALLFAVIFRFMPARALRWRFAAAGGLLTAMLFDLGRWGIGLYLTHASEPTAFGAASSFAALLLWLYYSAQIFLFGAEFTSCLGGLRAARRT